jgi:pyrroloquinoline quinone biosynthesis protein B
LLVLGAAAGGGYPQWNCRCRVCSLAWGRDPRVRPRTQSSLAASGDGKTWTLFNASPDIGAQICVNDALWPREGLRHSPVGAAVLTNGDIDHLAGLLTLREGHSFSIYALEPVHDALAANPIFAALDSTLVRRIIVKPDTPFEPTPGISVMLVPVPGKVPLYLEAEAPVIGGRGGETAAAFVRSARGAAAYVPGCASLPADLLSRLQDADILLFDGTVFVDDEMISAGVGAKTGRRMGHMPISGEGGSLDILRGLPARRKIYVHINNTNPILIDGSPERRVVEAAGFVVAHDGMELDL